MTHEEYKELIQLMVLGELGDEERGDLETHLGECRECQREFQEMKSLMTLVGDKRATEPTDRMLREARRNLRETIDREVELGRQPEELSVERPTQGMAWSGSRSPASPPGATRSARGWLDFIGGFRPAFAGAAAIAVGFVIGYLVFGRMATVTEIVDTSAPILTETDHELGPPDYSNVRLVNIDPRNEKVELQYDMVRPVRLRADFGDERVQRMLAQAVLDEESPGAQIRAIKTIDAYVENPRDERIKQALITALTNDPIPGVRKHALYVLYKMPFDEDIKEACLAVLANDDNAGLRIAAINILAQATLEGQIDGKEVYDAVGAQLKGDENDYIRNQSDVFKQEVNGNGE
jgi:hypothetical protein